MTYNSKVLPEIYVRLPFHADRRVQFTVRIDHFRAFSAYWAVPAEAETAKEGQQLGGIDKEWLKELNDVYYRSK